MIVVGGVYREVCSFPKYSKIFGSGLKAACAISSLVDQIELYGFVSEKEKAEVLAIAKSFKVKCSLKIRPSEIGFHYFTPLSKPDIFGARSSLSLSVEGKNILSFGMLEGEAFLKAEKIVFDPQSPHNTSFQREKLKCQSLALVLNRHEAKSLSHEQDVEMGAAKLQKIFSANIVIIKCGALGAFVKDEKSGVWVGCYPSGSVWPIGSGDIFSGAFSVGWMEMGMNAVDAARFASKTVSAWTQMPSVLPIRSEDIENRKIELPIGKSSIYLAGPFFNLAQNWIIELSKSSLENLGAEVFSPVHHVGRGGDEVAKPDLEGIDRSTAVLALLDGLDTGTIFEIGYALAKGIKVIGFSETPKSDELKMVRGSGIPIYSDFSTAVYQAVWAGVK